MYKNTEEIKEAFIKKGWSKNIFFEQLTSRQAKNLGFGFLAEKIDNHKVFFKMLFCDNIYDDKGVLIAYGTLCNGKVRAL